MIRALIASVHAWFEQLAHDELVAELSAELARVKAECAALKQKIADDAVIDRVQRREVADARAELARRRGQN